MSLPPYLREAREGVSISIKAQPRASRTEIAGLHGAELKIRVAAPPVEVRWMVYSEIALPAAVSFTRNVLFFDPA